MACKCAGERRKQWPSIGCKHKFEVDLLRKGKGYHLAGFHIQAVPVQFNDQRFTLQQFGEQTCSAALTIITGCTTRLRAHTHPKPFIQASHDLYILFNHTQRTGSRPIYSDATDKAISFAMDLTVMAGTSPMTVI